VTRDGCRRVGWPSDVWRGLLRVPLSAMCSLALLVPFGAMGNIKGVLSAFRRRSVAYFHPGSWRTFIPTFTRGSGGWVHPTTFAGDPAALAPRATLREDVSAKTRVI